MTEQVMVVATDDLASFLRDRPHDLIRENTDAILDTLVERHFFIDRPTAEASPQYRQVIPYVLIRHGERYYLLQRTKRQTEARLHLKLSLGIGGHINPDTPDILDGLQKELEEEVEVVGDYDLEFAGILSDTSTEVSLVHLGVVYVLTAHTGDVRVRETEKMTGSWATAEEIRAQFDALETWSQIVFEALIE